MSKTCLEHYPALGYAAQVIGTNDVSADFKIFTYYHPDDGGSPFYQLRGSTSSPDPTAELSLAKVLVSGHIKWDGCANYRFEDEGTLHVCDRQDFLNIGLALAYAHDAAAELFPHADHKSVTTREERERVG